MKFFVHTTSFGDRIGCHIGYGGTQIFFAEPSPAPNRFITIEMPGLSHMTDHSVIRWVTDRTGADPNNRRLVHEIPADVWREPHLDDFLDAENYEQFAWWVNRQFDVDEIRAFEDAHVTDFHARLDQAAAMPQEPLEARRAREVAYDRVLEKTKRLYNVLGQMPHTVQQRLNDMRRTSDEEELANSYPKPFELGAALDLAEGLQDAWIRLLAMRRIAQDIAVLPDDEAVELTRKLMEKLRSRKTARESIRWDVTFFATLERYLDFGHSYTGEELDISKAVETVIPLNWDFWAAARVGRVVPGRRALVVSENGKYKAIVKGQRKLKHRVAETGELVRHGVRLVMREGPQSSLDKELMEVERLLTLAQVDPAQVLEQLRGRDIGPAHPVWAAGERAAREPEWARVLADLAIEIVVGIDADVARGMLKRQKR